MNVSNEEARLAELEALNRALGEAEKHKNTALLKQLIASDYTGVAADGSLITKEELLARFQSPDLCFDLLATSDVRVRLFGSTALVSGRTEMRGAFAGTNFAGSFRYVDLWVQRDNRWQVVYSQMTPEAG
jgi:hypothetical protein